MATAENTKYSAFFLNKSLFQEKLVIQQQNLEVQLFNLKQIHGTFNVRAAECKPPTLRHSKTHWASFRNISEKQSYQIIKT